MTSWMRRLFTATSDMPAYARTAERDDGLFLPNFCSTASLFVIVLIGALLAILLTLADRSDLAFSFELLGQQAFFILWVSLSSCAMLCWARSHLRQYSQVTSGLLAWCMILFNTLIVSLLAYWLRQYDPTLQNINLIEFSLRNVFIAAMVSALLLRYFYIQHHWQRQIRAEAEARVQALQSRIRPHFLFNCMNTIASLTRLKPELAEQTVEDLADLFRASLADQRTHSTLAEELALSRQYLRIEALRLGSRLQVDWQIDALPEDALLPSLTLQPLLENAIYHGIEPCADGGVVSIRGHRAGNKLSLLIENPIAKPKADAAGFQQRKGNQLAQENTQQRLNLFYANSGFVNAQMRSKVSDSHYNVTLSFPYITTLS